MGFLDGWALGRVLGWVFVGGCWVATSDVRHAGGGATRSALTQVQARVVRVHVCVCVC
jgi:hypothetical protein